MSLSVLFIVEGKRPDKALIETIIEKYKMNSSCELFIVGANIYQLYSKMKSENFECDVKAALKEMKTSEDDKEKLSREYTYTYLVFDCDAQDIYKKSERDSKERNIETIISDNMKILSEMADYFTNETDPTIGKLYINYPMIESFRDCDDYFDPEYENKTVMIDQIGENQYKNATGRTKIGSLDVRRFTQEQIESLTKMNIWKLNKIICDQWGPISYPQYKHVSNQCLIIENEIMKYLPERKIAIINTLLFWPVDYYGNKDGFYNRLMGLSESI